jgi:hypothetical protein
MKRYMKHVLALAEGLMRTVSLTFLTSSIDLTAR